MPSTNPLFSLHMYSSVYASDKARVVPRVSRADDALDRDHRRRAHLRRRADSINPLAPRSAQNTMVTYCSNRAVNVCGGPCTVYNGGATCLNAHDTNCLAATHNVGFCDRAGCRGSCNQLSTCGTRLDNGFCFTPGTKSILVPSA